MFNLYCAFQSWQILLEFLVQVKGVQIQCYLFWWCYIPHLSHTYSRITTSKSKHGGPKSIWLIYEWRSFFNKQCIWNFEILMEDFKKFQCIHWLNSHDCFNILHIAQLLSFPRYVKISNMWHTIMRKSSCEFY